MFKRITRDLHEQAKQFTNNMISKWIHKLKPGQLLCTNCTYCDMKESIKHIPINTLSSIYCSYAAKNFIYDWKTNTCNKREIRSGIIIIKY